MLSRIALTIMVMSIGYSQVSYPEKSQIGQWRWQKEQLRFTHDKEAHVAASAYLYTTLRYKGYSEWDSFKYTLALGILKETTDALLLQLKMRHSSLSTTQNYLNDTQLKWTKQVESMKVIA